MSESTPGLTVAQNQEAADIRAELDAILPNWRDNAKLPPLQYDYLARIKFLRKRLSLVTGQGANGALFGLSNISQSPHPDWGVKIEDQMINGVRTPIAHPIPPTPGEAMNPVFFTGPPKVAAADLIADPIALAERLKTPLEVVEELIRACPIGTPKAAYVETKVREAKERDAARQAARNPPPKPVAPPPVTE